MVRRVVELQEQLDYERNRREQLEAMVDEYKMKLIQLQSAAEAESVNIKQILNPIIISSNNIYSAGVQQRLAQ